MSRSSELFDDFAQHYDKYRPSYPEEIVDDLIRFTRIQRGAKVLEVGAGTGQLTRSLFKSGVSLTALEPGQNLAAILRKNFNADGLIVHDTPLEDLQSGEMYDAVISAQAFHWIDYTVGLDKVYQITSPQGLLSLLWRIDKSENTTFYKKTKPIYAKYYPEKSIGKSMQDNVSDFLSLVKNRSDFNIMVDKRYDVTECYTVESYIGLLKTYSGVIGLSEPMRREFLDEIRNVILNMGGSIDRIFELALIVVGKNKKGASF